MQLEKLNLGKITLLEDTDGDGKFDKSTPTPSTSAPLNWPKSAWPVPTWKT